MRSLSAWLILTDSSLVGSTAPDFLVDTKSPTLTYTNIQTFNISIATKKIKKKTVHKNTCSDSITSGSLATAIVLACNSIESLTI
ncbi:hypothetical protein HanRHA438_Chr16g0749361 [Helianthus annuus]|nr:hypothetical protein HanRHA438_Chr16g0749361 [Helianthus annuus]